MGSAMAGAKAVSRSRAGRVGRGLRVSSAEFRAPPREYATVGVLAVNPDGGRVDVDIAGTKRRLGRSATDRPSGPQLVLSSDR
jgi:hypothetical protein